MKTKVNLIASLFILFFATNCLALDTICTPPTCAVYKVSSSDGVKLNVYDWGASSPNRPAILLVHGFPHNGLGWVNQINSLLRIKYRIITMDWRGQGLSDKPATTSYNQALLADDLKAVLGALQVKNVVLVGSSLGGLPVECYLNVYGTNNNGVKVKGVVLVGAVADLAGASFITSAAHDAIGQSLIATTPDEFTAGSQSFLTLSTLAPLAPGLNDFYLTQDLLTPAASRLAILDALTPSNYNINLASASVKTLIIWGANDAVVDVAGGTYLRNSIPGSKLVVVPNAGHLVQIEKPVAFNLLLGNFADSVN